MAKRIIYECDRCGKVFNLNNDQKSRVVISFQIVDKFGAQVAGNKFDLCPECAKHMAQYMKKETLLNF